MKTVSRFLISLCTLALFVSSCGQSADSISEGQVLKLANAEMKIYAKNQTFTAITTGQYECNDAIERETLRKMEAAGLITYDVTRYAWWEKSQKSGLQSYEEPYYIYGYYAGSETRNRSVNRTVYNFEDHYIVKVQLTKKGKKKKGQEHKDI